MPRTTTACAAALLAAGLCADRAAAQTAEGDSIHWAYAAYFGTGRYKIDGADEIFAIGYRPGWTRREPELGDDGRRRAGIAFRLPFALGAYELELDAPFQNVALDNVSVLSIVPGVERLIPVSERWRLKQVAHLGWGTEAGGASSALIYWAALKSELRFGAPGRSWTLTNAITYAGYSPDAGPSDQALPLMSGIEFQRALDKRLGGDPLSLHWHIAYTQYLNDVDFAVAAVDQAFINIENEWELGMAFGKTGHKLELWRLSWDRVGLAYRFSPGGDFKGLSVTFGTLFDR